MVSRNDIDWLLVLIGLGAEVNTESELKAIFDPVDTDEDSLISYEDFKLFL